MSSVAVKNQETASPSPLDRLHVGILAGVVYILGSLAILFKLLRTLWFDTLGLPHTAVAVALLLVVGAVVAGGLVFLGVRLLGRQPTPGVKAGIFTSLVVLLGIVLFTRVLSLWLEGLVYDSAALSEPVGIGVTVGVAVVLLVLAVRFLFLAPSFGAKMVAFEEQGWFSTTSFKRSQGQRVRRGTMLGILILVGCGIYAMLAHQTLAGAGNWSINIPFTGKAQVIALNDAAATLGAALPTNEKGEPQLAFPVDLRTFRENNARLKRDYVKIEDAGDAPDLRKGEVVPKTEYEKEAQPFRGKKDAGREPTISTKPLEPATATISYATLTLLPDVKYTLPILLTALALWFAWRIVNVPMFGDFLIATEAELNKVSWTTRRRLVQDTIVVLMTVVLFTLFLLVVDVAWAEILSLKHIEVIKVLPPGSGGQKANEQNW